MQKKGVYKIHCSCNPNKAYFGQTRVNIATRMFQHKKNVESTKQDENISGISKHAQICNTGTICWESPTIIKTYNEKTKTNCRETYLLERALKSKRMIQLEKATMTHS